MLKVYINEEEVVANQNFTIQKHMLNTPSVILNNLCPKTWCENRDYSSFYHPLDYSKCKIQEEIYYPDLPGTTVSSTNASLTITDADTTKLSELTKIDGNTTQSGTPTPTTPQPINVVSGRQDITTCGKNLLPNNASSQTKHDIVFTKNEDGSVYAKGTASALTQIDVYGTNANPIPNTFPNGTYTLSGGIKANQALTIKVFRTGGNNYYASSGTGVSFTIDDNTTGIWVYLNIANGQEVDGTFYPMLEKGNTPSQYEKYKGNTYEINLGKNLLDITATSQEVNGVQFTINADKSITISGTATADAYLYLIGQNNFLMLEAGSYTRSGTLDGNDISGITLQFRKDGYGGGDIFSSAGIRTRSATLTETTKVVARLRVANGTQISTPITIYPMIVKGSYALNSALSYAPYKTPIELCKIGNYQDFIKRGTGKNLFDKDTADIVTGYIDGTTGDLVLGGTSKATREYIPILPNTNMNISGFNNIVLAFYNQDKTFIERVLTGSNSYTFNRNAYYIRIQGLGDSFNADTIMLNEGSTALPYEPYGMYNKWYIEKQIGKVVLDGSENWIKINNQNVDRFQISFNTGDRTLYSNYFKGYDTYVNNIGAIMTNANKNIIALNYSVVGTTDLATFKTWLSTHNTSLYYVLATPTYTEITDSELIGQLNALQLLNGLNNISISSGDLPGEITIHYNYQIAHTDIDLLFCGVVKNSGKISLNPREPHYSSLQILDFKTFLSEGETLDYVIYQKTILEAIQQVIGTISEYGFVLGNVNILNPDDIIGAYSTKDKTAYDVFNYIADITQSRWTTRMINENQVAIDFYDPTLMPEGTAIDYTDTFFNNNLIDDIKYSYGTNNYRNKQVMVSNQVYSNISQAQTIVANGYQTQFPTEQPIGKINSITSNGIPLTYATFNEKEMGYTADFYYSPGDNYFESDDLRSTGEVLVIDYTAIIEGRQVITNSLEIDRIKESTGRKGIVARYENRNDATTSLELQKIGESYIKYKGTPEIILTIQSRKNTWEVGQRVQFNAPIDELDTEYMVRSKKINYITSTETLFYTYELVSSFNSETEINYFDNQRAKATGNIGEGEYISRNIDIESTANIIFYDTETTEVQVSGDNELNAILNSPIVS